MKAPPRLRSESSSPGFVLIGVVMMALALTILGLSLFSLSSYEAQFMNRSLDESQALQHAMAGLDRARFALSVPPDTLGQVKRNLPYEHVIWARATQPRAGQPIDSSGPVYFGGNPVTLEVTAKYRGVSRTVAGQYRPVLGESYYNRLLTIVQGVQMTSSFPGVSLTPPFDPFLYLLCGTTTLNGRVWEGNAPSDSLAWTNCLGLGNYVPGIRCESAPQVPLVDPFVSGHFAGATWVSVTPGPTANYRMLGTPGQVSYWRWDDTSNDFSIEESAGDPTITVNGRAVLLLPRGMKFEHTVRIVSGGDPDPCLVIVGGEGIDPNEGGWPHPGIWFKDALKADIPVILVSDEQVLVERFHSYAVGGATTYADNISIYAKNLFMRGPWIGALGTRLRLQYGPAMEAHIAALTAVNALPNAVSSVPMTLIPGTWRVVR